MFDDGDEDGGGSVEKKDLERLMMYMWQELGCEQPAERDVRREVAAMLRRFDVNGDGVISFEEFLEMLFVVIYI